jgi:exopolyphosphatase/guanosine-5'-triphosphate,3'-diphosphate pyrophosphatase
MYACIDLGSNSFHLLVGEMVEGKIQIVERCSDKVQLGEDAKKTGVISKGAFQRGLDCLKNFKQILDQYPIERYWALGTNTFRVTSNAAEFIAAAAELGIEIFIISGIQEAVLIYAGVITELPASADNRLVIDIGGGSTEVIIGAGQNRLLTESMVIGCVTWRDTFFASNDRAVLDGAMDKGLLKAREVFQANALALKRAGWQEIYASSGTVKMLASICESAGGPAGQIDYSKLMELRPRFLDCVADGIELRGLKERRLDLLLPGWCIIVGLMEVYGIKTIRFSATALREGMLDFIVKNKKTIETMSSSNLPAVSVAEP